jgi:serine/threonine-protein kinase
MLVRRGDDPDFVKVLDFGLSRLNEADLGVATRAGAVLGTARYVSPEGARGEPVDAHADVYAMGTILFECLAGRTPFDADSAVKLLVKQSAEAPPDVRELEPARDTPAPIAELIARCLAKDRERRPADGRAFGRALARAAAEAGLGAGKLAPRPTLFGTRSQRLLGAERTRLLGSPEVTRSEAPELSVFAPLSPDPLRSSAGVPSGPKRSTQLRRLALLAACFVLGASGALGVGSHFGACAR